MAYLGHRESHPGPRAPGRLAGTQMMARLLRKALTADVIGLVLIVIALQALTYGIASSLRNTDTRFFFWVCLLAALLSFGLSKGSLNGMQAAAGMAALGLLGIWILGARLAYPLIDLGDAVLAVILQIPSSIETRTPVDTSGIAEAWLVITRASVELGVRVRSWLFSIDQDATVNDPLVRNMAWVLIMWLLSAWMGWFTGRRNAIASLLPPIALLAAVTSYSGNKIEMLWLLVFILLLLMGIWNYRNHTDQWEERRVDYSESIRYDSTQAVIFLAVTIGVIAFITPSLSWREIRDFLRERNQTSGSETAEMFGVQQQPASPANSVVQRPSLPREHLLSGGYAQSEKIVMTIRTGELPPAANADLLASTPRRYYWRSTTYDTYIGAGWVTSFASPQTVQADTPLIPGLLDGYRLVHLDVEMVAPEGKLFWSGILFSTDVPFTASWRVRPRSSLFAGRSDLLQADLFVALSDADSYQADSYVPLASEEDLRAATTEYPDHVRDRYISLPGSIPPRVRQLAHAITVNQANAYDKAKEIEAYLRETYPYDLEIPAPPDEQDVADYFLFDLRRGYCDYYATAMVVLARASGLPARFVSGYSSGSYDAPNAQYVVRELNAHSWAEVYFPEIGWVEFEPTASQPEFDRSLPDVIVSADQDAESTASELLYRFRLEQVIDWLSPVAVVIVLLLLYFTLFEKWWLMRLAPERAIENVYLRLYRLGRPLAGARTGAETAYEFMQKLADKIDDIGERYRFTKPFSSARRDIEFLTEMYYRSLFTRKQLQKDDARMALDTWKHLRLRLVIARLHAIASPVARVRRSAPLRGETLRAKGSG